MPEVLALLLHLSDNPYENTTVKDLDLFEKSAPPSPLKWSELLEDDPLDNASGIWDGVDFTADSSEDEEDVSLSRSSTAEGSEIAAQAIDIEDCDSAKVFHALGLCLDQTHVEESIQLQIQNRPYQLETQTVETTIITETQLVREVLLLLLGLPTAVFAHTSGGKTHSQAGYRISGVSRQSLEHALAILQGIGAGLGIIRAWVARVETDPLLQTLQAALTLRLRDIDDTFSCKENQVLQQCSSDYITILQLLSEARLQTSALLPVADLLGSTEMWERGRSFTILESLYALVCNLQMVGDLQGYRSMAELFLECFDRYTRPIRMWMESGELDEKDAGFFIRQKQTRVTLTSLWDDQYEILLGDNGLPRAPGFLHLATSRIFTSGKSRNFLKHLELMPDKGIEDLCLGDSLTHRNVCGASTSSNYSPFSDLFATALNAWLATRYQSSNFRLREALNFKSGLRESLDAIEYIYLFRNGALCGQITSVLGDLIDLGNHARIDDHVVTELFRRIFDNVDCIADDRLAVHIESDGHGSVPYRDQPSQIITSLIVSYNLSWAISNIIKPETFKTYQQVLVLLLQVNRAKLVLESQSICKDVLISKSNKRNFVLISLRHRLLWFVNCFLSYLTAAVLSEACSLMRTRMEEAEDLDDMIAVHQSYISRLQRQTFLTPKLQPTKQAITSMLDLVIIFSSTWKEIFSNEQMPRPNEELEANQLSTRGDGEDWNLGDVPDEQIGVAFTSNKKLKQISSTYKRLLAFVTAGVQDAHRTDSMPCWETLLVTLALGVID